MDPHQSKPVMSEAAAMRIPHDPRIGKRFGGCRIERYIGCGAVSRVYRAIRETDASPVAVKILADDAASDDDFLARFRREVELCRKLSHPNIVAVHDHGCQDGCHFLVMELVEGPSLEQLIDERGPLAWRQAAELFLQLGQALDHLGRHGIVHRDIKPGNIVLTASGEAKLIDLGFAKRVRTDSDLSLEQTMAGVALGSPAYMPPEQVLDAKSATHAADIYGLGASLFHAVTGRPPFQAANVHATMRQVLYEKPPVPTSLVADLPAAMSALIVWTLNKEPKHRPESAAIFVRELQNALYRPDSAGRVRTQRLKQFHLWVWGPVAAVVVLAVIGSLWWVLRHCR